MYILFYMNIIYIYMYKQLHGTIWCAPCCKVASWSCKLLYAVNNMSTMDFGTCLLPSIGNSHPN